MVCTDGLANVGLGALDVKDDAARREVEVPSYSSQLIDCFSIHVVLFDKLLNYFCISFMFICAYASIWPTVLV